MSLRVHFNDNYARNHSLVPIITNPAEPGNNLKILAITGPLLKYITYKRNR